MPPSCRKGGMMADPAATDPDPYSLLLGGLSSAGAFDKGVWSLKKKSGWQLFPTAPVETPKARWKGSFCRIDDSSVVLFGGSDETNYFDDTWLLNQKGSLGGEWSEVKTKNKRPSKRRAHTGVVAGNKNLIIFGGKDGETKQPLRDLWVLNLKSWEWRDKSDLVFPGAPRKGHTAVMIDHKMVVFGGRSSNTDYYDDLIVLEFDDQWEPMKWREIEIAKDAKRPSHRNHHVAARLSDKRMLIYGGRGGHDPSVPLKADIWIFDLKTSAWTEITPIPDPYLPPMVATPKARIESANANLDSLTVVVAGGRDWQGKVLNDAWSLELVKDGDTAKWHAISPLDCSTEELSESAAFVSMGFFLGLCIILGLSFYVRFRMQRRRAPYEPIGDNKRATFLDA